MSKISLEFNMNPAGIADLSVMLNKAKKVRENWSLNGMVLHMVSWIIVYLRRYFITRLV